MLKPSIFLILGFIIGLMTINVSAAVDTSVLKTYVEAYNKGELAGSECALKLAIDSTNEVSVNALEQCYLKHLKLAVKSEFDYNI